MEIYNIPAEEGYHSIQPFSAVLFLLNSEVLYFIIPVVTLAAVCIGLYLAWELHELPTWRNRKQRLPQTIFVTALTIMGLFVHWVWVVAFALAFVDWKKLEKAIIRLMFYYKEDNINDVFRDVDKRYDSEEIPEEFWTMDISTFGADEKKLQELAEKKKIKKPPSKFKIIMRNLYLMGRDGINAIKESIKQRLDKKRRTIPKK